MRASSDPTYALQTVKPFWKVLRTYSQIPREMLGDLEASPADLRVPVAGAQAFLRNVIALTGDEDLGLRAARATEAGSFSVLEYAAASAATWRESLETVFRYSHLMNEAADFELRVVGSEAQVVLRSTVPLVRAGVDYQSAALYVAAGRWLHPMPNEMQILFSHDEPADTTQYENTFSPGRLVFGAGFSGFIFDAQRLDTKLPNADPTLYNILHMHADRLLAELAPGDGLVEQVRAHILSTLNSRPVTATETATKMKIARRTLTRRLRQEGTSFTALLNEVRRHAALRYMEATDHSVEDVAFLVGFSEPSPFVRAFKRWTGMPPIAYRKAHRSG